MEKRKLGKTGLEVSALSLGTMELHWLEEKSAMNLLDAALEHGINYFDASPEYPLAEYFLGKAFSHRRDKVVLATKCGDNMTGIGPLYLFDRKTIMANVEESLRLMKTDYVDVLQLHGVTPELLEGGNAGEAMETLREIKKSGKARFVGATVCNRAPGKYGYPAGYGYNSILRLAAWDDIDVIQLVYGGLTRLSENVIQKAHDDYGTGVVARGGIKKYDDTYDERYEVARLEELAGPGETRTDFLLRYVLSHPGIATAAIGTKNVNHLLDNIKAADKGILPENVYAEAKQRLTFAGAVPGPTDMKLDW